MLGHRWRAPQTGTIDDSNIHGKPRFRRHRRIIEAYPQAPPIAFGHGRADFRGTSKRGRFVEGLMETTIKVDHWRKQGKRSSSYVSKGRQVIFFRGEMSDLTKDPLAENGAPQIQSKDAPALGDPKAAVTLVEYSDFECPVCPESPRCSCVACCRIMPARCGWCSRTFRLEQLHPVGHERQPLPGRWRPTSKTQRALLEDV